MEVPHQIYKIDINDVNAPQVKIIESVNDKSVRIVDVHLYANSLHLSVPSNSIVTASFVTDGILIKDNVKCSVNNDGNIEVPIDNKNITTLSGIMSVEVKICDTSSSYILTPPFAFKVRVKPSIIDKAVVNVKSLGTVTDIIKEVIEARGNYSTLSEAINAMAGSGGGTGTVPPNLYELLSNKVKTFDKKFSDSEKYPTALAVIKYLTDYYYDYDEIDDKLGKKADELGITVLFDSNFVPIKCAILPELGAGFATGNVNVVTAFVPSNVTSITSGAFYGCTNLTDIYIDNVAGAVEISPKTIPDTTEIHYADDFNALSNAFKGLMGVNSKINSKADTEAVNAALNKKADTEAVNAALNKKADTETVNTELDKKADKATTLSGYRITDAYTKTGSKSRFALSVSVLFDENDIPIKTSDLTVLSAGYATSNLNVKTAFISSKVTRIQSGAFTGCSNLTDMYIDNINRQITIEDEAIPSTATIHCVDDYNALSQIENALKNINSNISNNFQSDLPDFWDAQRLKGEIPTFNLPMEALTRLITVTNNDKKLALNYTTIQNGDFVKVADTGDIYIVKDQGRLGREDAFEKISGQSVDNIETGHGDFEISQSAAERVRSANFEYQKIGDWVQLYAYVDFKAFTPPSAMTNIMLSNLPYVCKNAVNPREMCVTTQKRQMLWAIGVNSSSLTLLFLNTDEFVEGERLSFSIRYKIS